MSNLKLKPLKLNSVTAKWVHSFLLFTFLMSDVAADVIRKVTYREEVSSLGEHQSVIRAVVRL